MSLYTTKILLVIFCSNFLFGSLFAEKKFNLGKIKIIVETQNKLPITISSASGVDYFNGNYYIVSDNNSYLFILDKSQRVVNKIKLYDAPLNPKGVISKSQKEDLESISIDKYSKTPTLMTLGSGSSPLRNNGYIINLRTKEKTKLDLSQLYQAMLKQGKFPPKTYLNIEGLAITQDHIYLANRGNSYINLLYIFDKKELSNYLLDTGRSIPTMKILPLKLPAIGKHMSTISGLGYSPVNNTLLFTSSIEVDSSSYDDGMILASFVGAVPISKLKPYVDLTNFSDAIINKHGIIQTKAEGIVAIKSYKKDISVFVVSDNDNGVSDAFEEVVNYH
jgi:hypothetical protein